MAVPRRRETAGEGGEWVVEKRVGGKNGGKHDGDRGTEFLEIRGVRRRIGEKGRNAV